MARGNTNCWGRCFLNVVSGVVDARQPVPVKEVVDCHHMNYFVSEAGMNINEQF